MAEFFAWLFLSVSVLFATAYMSTISNFTVYKGQAIERGYALYCPTTGDFAWKGECDE